MSERTAELGRQLAAARAEVNRLLAELAESVKADRKAGGRASDIINAAGVSLNTIYRRFHEADAEKEK